jgi:hypothetical protein
MKFKARYGNYYYSCQWLNNPAAPDDAEFKAEWLNHFAFRLSAAGQHDAGRIWIQHEVRDGIIRKDILQCGLRLCMVSDPNHSGNSAAGRCRHSIVVVGMSDSGNYYLLDCWAAHASYDVYINELYNIAKRWGLHDVGLETIGAQKYLAYHINYRNTFESWPLRIIEVKGEIDSGDGSPTRNKLWRIRNALSPIAESGRLWVQKKHQDFNAEFIGFPKGKYLDILDALAYVPQMLQPPLSEARNQMWLARNRAQAKMLNRPYSSLIGRA